MAIRNIAHSIRAGEIALGVAVGVESMSLKYVRSTHLLATNPLRYRSRSPRPTPIVADVVSANAQARDCIQVCAGTWIRHMLLYLADHRAAHGVDLGDGRSNVQHISAKAGRICAHFSHPSNKGSAHPLLWSPSSRKGETEACIVQAQADGVFSDEIIPIELRGTMVSVDDTIRPNVSAEGLAALKSSFPEWGDASTTAGNASGVGDGAALCILTTRARAEAKGLDILAKFVATAIVGVEPRHMGIAPIYAIPKVLTQTGLNSQDIDVYEVSAFSVSLSHRLHESRDYEPDQRSICVAVRLLR